MSFWPSVYNKIQNQIKLIEYRRRFPKDSEYAYMYISKPVKAICAIIYFGKIHSLSDWKNEYASNEEISNRIKSFSSKYQYGAEILSVQPIVPITLESLRNNVPNFHPPQSYILVENNECLDRYLRENIKKIDGKITNDLTEIFPEHICKEY